MATIRNLIVSLQARTEQFDRAMQQSRQEVQGLRADMASHAAASQNFGAAFTRVGATALAGLASVQALRSGLQQMIAAGEQSQRMTTAFTAVAGGVENARKEMDFARQSANKLGVEQGNLAQQYLQLTAAAKGTALEGQATRDIFTAITNAGQKLALTQDQVGRALTATQQMMSKGTVSAEELRGQLGEALPGAFQIAARAMGVTTEELDKMLEKGQVMANEFLPRFAAQLRSELGEASTEATATASQGFARLGNALTDMVSGPGKALSNWLGGILSDLAKIITDAKTVKDRMDELAKSRMQEGIQAATGGRGAADTPANRARLKELEDLNREILNTESAIDRIYKQGLGESNEEVTRRLAADRRREERLLEELKARKAAIEATLTTTTGMYPGEDMAVETGTGLQARQSSIAARQKEIVKGFEDIKSAADQVASTKFPWQTEFERTKAELKVIQDGLEKIAKGDPKGQIVTRTLEGEKLLLDLMEREGTLRAKIAATEKATEADKDAQREAEKKAREGERDAAREVADQQRTARQEEAAYQDAMGQTAEQRREALQALVSNLIDQRNQLTMNADALLEYRLQTLQADEATRRLVQSVHEDILAAQKKADIEKQHAKEIIQINREVLQAQERQAEETKKRQEEIGQATVGIVTGMIDALKQGGDAWEQFGQRVLESLMRIVIEKSNIESQLGKLVEKGLSALVKLLGASGGPDVVGPLDSNQFSTNYSMNVPLRAEGGPVTARRAYLVGEKGPELFASASPGRIYTNTDLRRTLDYSRAISHMSTTNSTMYDQRAITYAGSTIMAHAGLRAHATTSAPPPIYNITWNIQTPDVRGFQQAQSTMQRQMLLAVNAATRST